LGQLSQDAGSSAIIVAGDFNSTYDMRPFRRLLDEGYRDAVEQAGAGLTFSFPTWRWVWAPMIGIDHVLVHNCAATWARTASVSGSDHFALLTTIDVPVDLTAS
jgi:endonuclease/exonuclease/phosphatase (EEP) superfamily protein YafD